MKFIFLDIDGVLNRHEPTASGYCGIEREKAEFLNRILDAVPDCQIVISSAWRYMIHSGATTLRGFSHLLSTHGVKCAGRLHGITEMDGDLPESDHFDAEAWRRRGLQWRAEQIAHYVAAHAPDAYVVIDDLPLEVPNLIKTQPTLGLTWLDASDAIQQLTLYQSEAAK